MYYYLLDKDINSKQPNDDLARSNEVKLLKNSG